MSTEGKFIVIVQLHGTNKGLFTQAKVHTRPLCSVPCENQVLLGRKQKGSIYRRHTEPVLNSFGIR